MDPRLDREKAFHDEAFAHDSRAKIRKYYSLAEDSKAYFFRCVSTLALEKDVLEYGCGAGRVAPHVATLASHTHGIDISESAIRLAKESVSAAGLADRVILQVMNAEAMSFSECSFDLVYGSGILHHLDLAKSLSEICRVLRPRGKAVFLEPLGHNPVLRLFRRLTPSLRTRDEHPLLASDIRLASLYFGEVRVTFWHFTTLLAAPLVRLGVSKSVVRALAAFDHLLFRLVPPIRWLAWLAVLEFGDPRKDA